MLTAQVCQLLSLSYLMLATTALEFGARGTWRGSLVFHGPFLAKPLAGLPGSWPPLTGVEAPYAAGGPPARASAPAASTEITYLTPFRMTDRAFLWGFRGGARQRRSPVPSRASGSVP